MLNILKVPEGLIEVPEQTLLASGGGGGASGGGGPGSPASSLAGRLQELASDFTLVSGAVEVSGNARSMASDCSRSAGFLSEAAERLGRAALDVTGPSALVGPTNHQELLGFARVVFSRAGEEKAYRTAETLIALSDRLITTLEMEASPRPFLERRSRARMAEAQPEPALPQATRPSERPTAEGSPARQSPERILERLRARLLDLSGRNPLLNYRHPKKKSLRIVDELPGALFAALTGNKSFLFAPVPGVEEEKKQAGWGKSSSDPEAKTRLADRVAQEARARGINPSYELPFPDAEAEEVVSKHQDNRLQTLWAPQALEAQLQHLHAEMRTAIQESGANTLHLAFGFLRWREGGPDAKARLAPLVLLPVSIARDSLDKDTRTQLYRVSSTGESAETNVTLVEKLRQEFKVELPVYDEDSDLEAYFAKVTETLKSLPQGWGLERAVTLGLFSFARLLMWRDLDPKRWPTGTSLLSRPLIPGLLKGVRADRDSSGGGGGGGGDSSSSDEVYDLDAPETRAQIPPLALDADSAQHSVLVDVLKGRSLVVQGPPGTGKSQTITNLIAAAMKAGKTVLFVTQKLAALEVVARRLEEAGLGDFCLPLHSHKTQKSELLAFIKQRLERSGDRSVASELSRAQTQLDKTVDRLRQHAHEMHVAYGAMRCTPHEAFWRASRFEREHSASLKALSDVRLLSPENVGREQLEEARQQLREFEAELRSVFPVSGGLAAHPWFGVDRPDLNPSETKRLFEVVAAWRSHHRRMSETAASLQGTLGVPCPTPAAALGLSQAILSLPAPPAALPPALLRAAGTSAGRAALATFVSSLQSAQRACVPLTPQLLERFDDARLIDARARCGVAGQSFSPGVTLRGVQAALHSVRELSAAAGALAEVTDLLASKLKLTLPDSLEARQQLLLAVQGMRRLSPSATAQRSASLFQEETRDQVAAAAGKVEALKRQRAALEERFDLALVPEVGTLKQHLESVVGAPFIPWLSSGYRTARRAYRMFNKGGPAGRQVVAAGYAEVVGHQVRVAEFQADPLLGAALGPRFRGLETNFPAIAELLSFFDRLKAQLNPLGASGRELHRALRDAPLEVLEECWEVLEQRSGAVAGGEAMARHWATLLESRVADVESLQRGTLEQARTRLETVALDAEKLVKLGADLELDPAATFAKVIERVGNLEDAKQSLSSLGAQTQVIGWLGPLWKQIQTAPEPLAGLLDFTAAVGALPEGDVLVRALLTPELERLHAEVSQLAAGAVEGLPAWAEAKEATEALGGLREDAWGTFTSTFEEVEARLGRAAENPTALQGWLSYLRKRRVVREQVSGGVELVAQAEGEPQPLQDLPGLFEALFFKSLSDRMMEDLPTLRDFSGRAHETCRDQFSADDLKLTDLNRKQMAHELAARPIPPGQTGAVKQLTDCALLRHEIGKQRNHVPIRELMSRAGDALQAMMPCFMMGPQAVSQYLPNARLSFDIVVMDEASQMRPEDGLAALARGKQLVIVGDHQQLPPTSFFDRGLDDDADDDDDPQGDEGEPEAPKAATGKSVIEDSESILQAAVHAYPLRMLTWHYRSRHPSLIDFSNREFYHGRLLVFPSPTEAEHLGVKLERPANGVYQPGARINPGEAKAVVERVQEHARNRPDQSLLVVTLNMNQRELIEGAIWDAAKADPVLAGFLEARSKTLEPFDVKNLENVQGDERDQVFVSITIGPDETGRFAQNFGPINQADGHRRLNVLFTRARQGLRVFCSFDPGQLRTTEASSRGLLVLQRYLLEAAGAATVTSVADRPPDSDFEVAVLATLQARGLEAVPQIGVRGYWVDMGIRHPKRPGVFILGVECDGDLYHRARSARDRDRLRDAVLRGLGWNLIRVWSTDWYRDPVGQADRIAKRVEELLREEALNPPQARAPLPPAATPVQPAAPVARPTTVANGREPESTTEKVALPMPPRQPPGGAAAPVEVKDRQEALDLKPKAAVPVPAPTPAAPQAPSAPEQAPATWIQDEAGLEWARTPLEPMTWTAAKERHGEADAQGWRLPTRDELKSLLASAEAAKSLSGHLSGWYWSGQPDPSVRVPSAWAASFGLKDVRSCLKTSLFRVRLVRSRT